MKEELPITNIAEFVPASVSEQTCNISEVYEKIKHLEPFSQEENEKIANSLNKKRYVYTDIISTVLESEKGEYGGTIYPKIKIEEWKSFVLNVERKLENLPNKDYIYISLLENKDEHNEPDGTYELDFRIITNHNKQKFNHTIARDLIIFLERDREYLQKKKQAEKALEEKQLKEKEKEISILNLITRLQNKEISAEQFKELSNNL